MSIRLRSLVDYVDPAILDTHEKAVLGALADHGNDEGESIYPSIQRLMWKTSLSERGLQGVLNRLYEKQLVIKTKGGGGRNTNRWEINVDELRKISSDPQTVPWSTPAGRAGVPRTTREGAPQDVRLTPAPGAGDPLDNRQENLYSGEAEETKEITLDLTEVPGYPGQNRKEQDKLPTICPLCGGRPTIGIWDTETPCCHLPIKWLNHTRMEEKLDTARKGEPAKSRGESPDDKLTPGQEYILLAASTSSPSYKRDPNYRVLFTNKEKQKVADWEAERGLQFIKQQTDYWRKQGKCDRGLIITVCNSFGSAPTIPTTGNSTNGSEQPQREPTLVLTDSAKQLLGLE